MQGTADRNEHFISESFVKNRFGINGFVQLFHVEWNKWKPKAASPQFVFSQRGYTQFLAEGEPVDHTLEESFGKVESKLHDVFPVLDNAAESETTMVPEPIYDTLCWYCAHLWHLSPFAKAKAPANFVMQLNMDLKHGNLRPLQEFGVTAWDTCQILAMHMNGHRFILYGDDFHQWAFRVQCVKGIADRFMMFKHNVKWTVYNSPIELPISDVALIDMPESKEVHSFILPISPNKVLIGRILNGKQTPHNETIIYGGTLTREEAEKTVEIICLSAFKSVACRNKMDVAGIRKRAKENGVKFARIKDLKAVWEAGTKVFRFKKYLITPVSKEKYIEFIHSFILPPE